MNPGFLAQPDFSMISPGASLFWLVRVVTSKSLSPSLGNLRVKDIGGEGALIRARAIPAPHAWPAASWPCSAGNIP